MTFLHAKKIGAIAYGHMLDGPSVEKSNDLKPLARNTMVYHATELFWCLDRKGFPCRGYMSAEHFNGFPS